MPAVFVYVKMHRKDASKTVKRHEYITVSAVKCRRFTIDAEILLIERYCRKALKMLAKEGESVS